MEYEEQKMEKNQCLVVSGDCPAVSADADLYAGGFDSLVPGYAVLYGPRNAYSFYLVPGQQQEITRLNGQEIKFAGAAKAINIYLNSPFLNNRDPGYEKGEEEFLKAWALMPGRLQSHLDSLPLPADFKKSERKRLYYVACHSL